MKLKFFTLIALIFCSLEIFAKDEINNITGTWVGNRYQFNEEKNKYEQTFTYMFELTQEDNIVKGTSYIKNENGNYAEIAIRGIVEGNKFHFEEYEILRTIRPEGKIWCFKRGSITIAQKNGETIMSGETPSYMEIFGDECSGGVTYLTKLGGAIVTPTPSNGDIIAATKISDGIVIENSPNPFTDKTSISFNLPTKSEVKVEVIDINGQLVAELYSGLKESGKQTIVFDAQKFGLSNRFLITRITIGDQVFSKNMIQVH